jgi:signal transduction histidine kinase
VKPAACDRWGIRTVCKTYVDNQYGPSTVLFTKQRRTCSQQLTARYGWTGPSGGQVGGMARVGKHVGTSNWLNRRTSALVGSMTKRSAFQWVLDGVMAITLFAIFEGVADASVMVQVVLMTLVLQAFTSATIRPVVIRIAIASSCLALYWGAARLVGTNPREALDFAEWPFMFVLLVVVSTMAERRRTTSMRYANLYRLASDRLLTAQESERTKLARDLHDGVGQLLSSLAMTLEIAEAELPAGARATEKLNEARELLAGASDETRNVAGRLQPPRLAQRGLALALTELARRAAMPVRMNIDADAFEALSALPADTQLHVYRAAQEILSNAQRHSGASLLLFSVRLLSNGIEISGADDGRGFNASRSNDRGLGLTGMRDRAEAIGARLSLWSELGVGTTVRLVIPVQRAAALRSDVEAPAVQVAS